MFLNGGKSRLVGCLVFAAIVAAAILTGLGMKTDAHAEVRGPETLDQLDVETEELVYLPLMSTAPATPRPEWTASWWQWIEGVGEAPLSQTGTVDCSLGQSGDIWFLAGTGGGPPVERTCTVPQGKMLVIPLITVAWNNEPGEDLTVVEKQAVLDGVFSDSVPGIFNSKACNLNITWDGESRSYYRLMSPPFQRYADPEAVSDGFWFAHRPSVGAHEITFSGDLCDFDTDEPIFNVDVTYNLTVSPAE